MGRKKRNDAPVLEMTPFVDVTFLLIIFFLVTSVFRKEELALALKLPETTEGGASKKEVKQLAVELSKDEVAVNGKKSSMEELKATLKGLDPKTDISLRVDGTVEYKRVVKVFELFQSFNLNNLSLITQKEK